MKNYGVGDDAVVGDSVVTDSVLVVSDDGVGLADGVIVSVFLSQAASIPAARTRQMYLVIAGLYAKSAFA